MAILCAAFGGLAIKILDLLEITNLPKSKRPDLNDFFYWLPFLLFPILGAGLVGIYILSKIEMSPILAFNVGVSAPLIIRAMASAVPQKIISAQSSDDAKIN